MAELVGTLQSHGLTGELPSDIEMYRTAFLRPRSAPGFGTSGFATSEHSVSLLSDDGRPLSASRKLLAPLSTMKTKPQPKTFLGTP